MLNKNELSAICDKRLSYYSFATTSLDLYVVVRQCGSVLPLKQYILEKHDDCLNLIDLETWHDSDISERVKLSVDESCAWLQGSYTYVIVEGITCVKITYTRRE